MPTLQNNLIAELPGSVQRALGEKAAQDLVTWLTKQFTLSRVHITPAIARRKVNVLTLERVSNLFLADEPTLMQRANGDWIWSVPVDFTLPGHGRVGRVGQVEVNASDGQVYATRALLDEMANKAEALVEQLEAGEK